MKLYGYHWHPGINGNDGCEIEVPGLGKVSLSNCLSDELKKRIEEECYLALRLKMGQVINTVPENILEVV